VNSKSTAGWLRRRIEGILRRLRGEFLDMPGLRLTPEQVQRLCGIERMYLRAQPSYSTFPTRR
jgi:hypothetical protein